MKREYYLAALVARKQMNQSFTEEGFDDIRRSKNSCATTVIVTDKDHIHHCPNQACHAGLSNDYYGGFPEAKGTRNAVVSSVQYIGVPQEVADAYLEWLVKRSPYAKAFVTKSVKDIIKNGFICNTDVPSNLMAGGLIASRRLWEYQDAATTWYDLVQAGLNENIAFLAAHVFSNHHGRAYISYKSGHCSVQGGNISIDEAENFRDKKIQQPNSTYNEDFEYSGIHQMFCKPHAGSASFTNKVKNLVENTPRLNEKKDGNVFYIRGNAIQYAPYEDTIKYVAKKLGEEFNV